MKRNYFNQLPLREQVKQLGHCRFMQANEFVAGCDVLREKQIVIIGCGAQGLNQGLNLRDSGLQVSFALRDEAVKEKRPSWSRATEAGFEVGTFEGLIPSADLVINLTPDKQHSSVVELIMPMMKKGAALGYSHGFNVVEMGQQIRDDIVVIMVAPKCPGTEVREEFKRGFGVPTLIAVHPQNDAYGTGLELAKAWAYGIGGHRAGVLESSFVAEVKSDLMGEQTILCGLLQAGSLLCFNHMVRYGVAEEKAAQLVQFGWEKITEPLKIGGISLMMDCLDNRAKLVVFELAETIKHLMKPLFEKHQDNILNGKFSEGMMLDWRAGDEQLLAWREETRKSAFEQAPSSDEDVSDQYYFDNGILMVAFVKAGVELAFDTMVSSGISAESAYYESLHELPLIANTIARKRLFEMNVVISDTAEYGSYLFANIAYPTLESKVLDKLDGSVMGHCSLSKLQRPTYEKLQAMNRAITEHPVELVGKKLREYMVRKPSNVEASDIDQTPNTYNQKQTRNKAA